MLGRVGSGAGRPEFALFALRVNPNGYKLGRKARAPCYFRHQATVGHSRGTGDNRSLQDDLRHDSMIAAAPQPGVTVSTVRAWVTTPQSVPLLTVLTVLTVASLCFAPAPSA